MFYEESIIDGVLCWRNTPNGKWMPKIGANPTTAEKVRENLNSIIQQQKQAIAGLTAELASLQRERDGLQEKYEQLLYAVASKWPNESRHETALRYINERENSGSDTARGAGNGRGE